MSRLRSRIFVSLVLVIFPLDGPMGQRHEPDGRAEVRRGEDRRGGEEEPGRSGLPREREPLRAARLIPRVF